MNASTAKPEARETRFLLGAFSCGHLANDWAPGAVWLIAPAVALDMGWSPAELGALITVQAVGASLAYLPAGVLADHVRHRGRLLAMTFWWVAIGFFAASFAPGYWSLALLLAVAGLGDAAWHPIATGVLTKLMPSRRGEALGVHAIGGSLATVLAPLVVGYLLAAMDWRDALRLSVLPALIMGVVFVVYVAPRVPASNDSGMTRGDVHQFVRVWATRLGVGLLGVVVLYHMSVTALMSMTPLYLQSVHQFSTAGAGTVFAAGLLVGALVQPWLGRVSDRLGRRRVLGVVASAGALVSGAMWLAPSGFTLILMVVAAIGILVGVRAVVLALAVDFASQREGTTLGFVFALMDGVGALGALLAGTVAEWQLVNAFLLAGALALATGLLVVVLPPARAVAVAATAGRA